MTPTHPAFDPANMGLFDAIIGGNQDLKPAVGSDCNDLRLGQFGVPAPLASVRGAMRDPVRLVTLRRVPSQVADMVVLWISVVVASLHAIGARANKSFQHQGVRLANFLLAILPQSQKWPLIRIADCDGFYFVCLSVFYSSKIGHFINALVAYNIAPIFHRSNHIAVKGMLQYGAI
ncbi:hypothetical protein UFOVP1619_48 [uncultured Caudovirales phage]|uniref:Uncharacterized protein n=1 Tax=uncultured Caudovirales phage TaxID=2100421 RepID=A0A6J5SYG9_9CAUD|nr:hypothetical protein UFOVP1619_48 [uncultured Caudovirales phage]